jgi:hypothetical protein
MGETKPTRAQLFSKVTLKPDAETINFIQNTLVPYMRGAIKVAEGNSKNFGVLSTKTANSHEAEQVLDNSIRNSYLRWLQAGQPGKFVDFMAARWAPVGVANDPNNLNANWPTNVRSSLQQSLGPEQYNRWKALRLAQSGVGSEVAA